MAKAKLHDSKDLLKQYYTIEHKSIEWIAQRCSASESTIRSRLKKFGLL